MSAYMTRRQRSHCKAKTTSSKAGDSSSDYSILTFRTDIFIKGGFDRWPHITGSSSLHGNKVQSAVKKGLLVSFLKRRLSLLKN